MNRYANDWNTYSERWEGAYGTRYTDLGDEWCDDGTADRKWERWMLAAVAEPWLRKDARLLEIGPGGGKWTVRLASQVKDVTAFDVAVTMLDRTRARCAREGHDNVSCVLGNGDGLTGVRDDSMDIVFSYDVFVHIALEDTVAYLNEIARVLKPGGVAILHHAINDVKPAWDRIESHNDWYRDRANTLGQYYYYSQDALNRMYERAGLSVISTWSQYCTAIITVRKASETMVPSLERAIRVAATAGTPEALKAGIADLQRVAADAHAKALALSATLEQTKPGLGRYAVLQQLRRVFRG